MCIPDLSVRASMAYLTESGEMRGRTKGIRHKDKEVSCYVHLGTCISRAAGFTLIELLVVLSIIALLLSLAAPRYFQHVERSKEVVLRENLATVRDAIDQFHADTGQWPENLDSLVEQRYLRAVPLDPLTESRGTWLVVPAGESESGIRDIRSGAEVATADGRSYEEW